MSSPHQSDSGGKACGKEKQISLGMVGGTGPKIVSNYVMLRGCCPNCLMNKETMKLTEQRRMTVTL